jgi:hypothetical protein
MGRDMEASLKRCSVKEVLCGGSGDKGMRLRKGRPWTM